MSSCRALAALLFYPHRTPGAASFRGIDRGVMDDIERARYRRALGGSRAGTLFAKVPR